jgi:2-polyprenyl-3-methyl-5-hydroxy-6-metoxy-1,4-benzoquinol methylase
MQMKELPQAKGQQSLPWQIEMFQRSLKKHQKLKALLRLLGDIHKQECLLVTCGDNNGALNWYFRSHGGSWTWADVSGENIDQISQLLAEPVYSLPADTFPFPDGQFDCVVSIDVLEHLPEDQKFLREVGRVLKMGGRALVTVPNGDPSLLANRIKWRMGMTPEVYGHTRAGYTLAELQEAITRAGLAPSSSGGYSRFFTEMIELVINYGYVFVLSKKRDEVKPGHIAPVSSGELKRHGMAYRLYSIVFPLARLFSKLDMLLPGKTNNAVIVVAEKDYQR